MVDLPAPDGPTSATVWPGSTRNDTPCSTSSPRAVVEHGDLLQRGERHLVGRRVAEAHVVELDRHRPVRQRRRVGRLGDQRLDVEHLEHPLEADERGDHVEPGGGQRGERRVQAVEQQRHRHDGARRRARPRGRGSRRGRRSAPAPGPTPGSAPGRTPPSPSPSARRCRAPGRRAGRTRRPPASGRPNSFTSVAPGRREPLGHLRRHRRVVLGGLALEQPDPRADAASRDHEHRQEHEREQR